MGSGIADWQPSAIQLERESWRRRQTARSAAIAAASTLLVLGVVGGLVVTSPGW
jgi:polar amino acid transport system permease protein